MSDTAATEGRLGYMELPLTLLMLEREWVDMGEWPADAYDDTDAGVSAGVSRALLVGTLARALSEPRPELDECCMLGGLSL